MSLHIIKCKTILKINEIETINLTGYLNFYRPVEPGGGSTRARGRQGLWLLGVRPGSDQRSSGRAFRELATDQLTAKFPRGRSQPLPGPGLEALPSLRMPRKGSLAAKQLWFRKFLPLGPRPARPPVPGSLASSRKV